MNNSESVNFKREFFERLLTESQKKIDAAYNQKGPEAAAFTAIRCTIERAVVYFDAGFKEEALEEIRIACDVAQSKIFEGSGLYEEAVALLEKFQS